MSELFLTEQEERRLNAALQIVVFCYRTVGLGGAPYFVLFTEDTGWHKALVAR